MAVPDSSLSSEANGDAVLLQGEASNTGGQGGVDTTDRGGGGVRGKKGRTRPTSGYVLPEMPEASFINDLQHQDDRLVITAPANPLPLLSLSLCVSSDQTERSRVFRVRDHEHRSLTHPAQTDAAGQPVWLQWRQTSRPPGSGVCQPQPRHEGTTGPVSRGGARFSCGKTPFS